MLRIVPDPKFPDDPEHVLVQRNGETIACINLFVDRVAVAVVVLATAGRPVRTMMFTTADDVFGVNAGSNNDRHWMDYEYSPAPRVSRTWAPPVAVIIGEPPS